MSEEMEGPQGQSAYRRLLAEIRTGQLLPGARLRETELAERLGISRTPVREAIRQLEADGLVTHQARQGATIRNLDYAEVIELYEMRSVLEGTAARLAARMASQVELAELTEINEALALSAPGACRARAEPAVPPHPAGRGAQPLSRQDHERAAEDAADPRPHHAVGNRAPRSPPPPSIAP